MLIEIDTVRRRQAEIEAELTSLCATTRTAETPSARLEVLKARADVLRTLSLVHARLARGEPENLARLPTTAPRTASGCISLSWRVLLEVSLVAGPSVEGKLPALYYLYTAPQGTLAAVAGVRSLPCDSLVAEEAGPSASPLSARDLLSTFCVYPQRVGSSAFVFRSFPVWLPETVPAECVEEAVCRFFRENFPIPGGPGVGSSQFSSRRRTHAAGLVGEAACAVQPERSRSLTETPALDAAELSGAGPRR